MVSQIKQALKQHLVDSTAIVVENAPLFAAQELFFAGMSDAVSLHARVYGALSVYLGVGFVYSYGRDFCKEKLGIEQKSEFVKTLHDAVYTSTFAGAYSLPLYILSGSTDPKEIALATIGGGLIGFVNGAPQGYMLDVCRDLAGIKECTRSSYPVSLRKKSLAAKKVLALGLIGLSLATLTAMYSATSDESISLEKLVDRD